MQGRTYFSFRVCLHRWVENKREKKMISHLTWSSATEQNHPFKLALSASSTESFRHEKREKSKKKETLNFENKWRSEKNFFFLFTSDRKEKRRGEKATNFIFFLFTSEHWKCEWERERERQRLSKKRDGLY